MAATGEACCNHIGGSWSADTLKDLTGGMTIDDGDSIGGFSGAEPIVGMPIADGGAG